MIRMYTYLYYEAKVYVCIIHYFPVYLYLFIYICTYIRMYIGEVKTLMIQLLDGACTFVYTLVAHFFVSVQALYCDTGTLATACVSKMIL